MRLTDEQWNALAPVFDAEPTATDGAGLPLAVYVTSASPHETTLVEATLAARFTRDAFSAIGPTIATPWTGDWPSGASS